MIAEFLREWRVAKPVGPQGLGSLNGLLLTLKRLALLQAFNLVPQRIRGIAWRRDWLRRCRLCRYRHISRCIDSLGFDWLLNRWIDSAAVTEFLPIFSFEPGHYSAASGGV